MFQYLDAKDDCFTLGVLSKIVSNELNSMQSFKQRRKVYTDTASYLKRLYVVISAYLFSRQPQIKSPCC